jgi:hypothetical protein
MNDATFQRLTQINDELVDLCNWLKQRGDLETVSRLAPIVDSLTRVLINRPPRRNCNHEAHDRELAPRRGLAPLLFSPLLSLWGQRQ